MPQDLLDRPAAPPKVSPPGPGQADGNPRMNARGQFRGPAPRNEPEVEEALRRRIAKDTADIARRTAIEEEDGEVSTGTAGGIDEIPIAGWIVLGAEVGVAGYQAYQIYQDTKDLLKATEDLKAASGGGNNNKNVQVQGEDPCFIGPYNKNKCPGGFKHHVVPDRVLNFAAGSSSRIPNAPSYGQGMTICLSKQEHLDVHSILDPALEALGKNSSTGAGTAPMSQIVDKSIEAAEKVRPECKGKFDKVREQYKSMGNQPGRTTKGPPTAGSPAQNILSSGGAGGGTR